MTRRPIVYIYSHSHSLCVSSHSKDILTDLLEARTGCTSSPNHIMAQVSALVPCWMLRVASMLYRVMGEERVRREKRRELFGK